MISQFYELHTLPLLYMLHSQVPTEDTFIVHRRKIASSINNLFNAFVCVEGIRQRLCFCVHGGGSDRSSG